MTNVQGFLAHEKPREPIVPALTLLCAILSEVTFACGLRKDEMAHLLGILPSCGEDYIKGSEA